MKTNGRMESTEALLIYPKCIQTMQHVAILFILQLILTANSYYAINSSLLSYIRIAVELQIILI